MTPQPDNLPDKLSGLGVPRRALAGIPTDIPTECRDHAGALQTGEESAGDRAEMKSTA